MPNKTKLPKAVSRYFSQLGKRATGSKKARSSAQARAAALARWGKKKV